MTKIVVSDRARRDLDEIADYIARDNLGAALRFYDQARWTFETISRFPRAGAIFPVGGRSDFQTLRVWPIRRYRKYVVCYIIREGLPEVLRVVHGARDVGRVFGP